jgi:hypothetical protein
VSAAAHSAEFRKPRPGIARHDLAAAGVVVEITDDDAGIATCGTVLGDAVAAFTSLSVNLNSENVYPLLLI